MTFTTKIGENDQGRDLTWRKRSVKKRLGRVLKGNSRPALGSLFSHFLNICVENTEKVE